ncbi:hypothetical protein CYLTODRAFT_494124 [Cylindrobasidium torrendii FP15055 ss-10]|uniref:Uncharacterized protein n=1 Tax=Cylindrobasidium torrendii FP15055 ss-10 TaxID=1314674 RepID=A0A0D7AYZ0_9AGAR|nr:hypothetical protein CYLTODRAFT_494124 [Cylindrobasidium torrendii FP15055 ss-10]
MLHRAQDVSLSPLFTEPIEVRLIDPNSVNLRYFECFAGLWEGEFWEYFNLPLNKLQVQPSLRHYLSGMSALTFVPCDSVLRRIFDLYKRNSQCQATARERFDEISDISTSVYQVAAKFGSHTRLFTRHPTTHIVTEHKYPFTSLPEFAVSVHPCLAHLASTTLLGINANLPFSLAQEIGLFTLQKYFFVARAHSPCPSLTDASTESGSSLESISSVRSTRQPAPGDSKDVKLIASKFPRRTGQPVLGVRQKDAIAEEQRPTKRPRVAFKDVLQARGGAKKRVLSQRGAWR